MTDTTVFSPDYVTARQRFRDAASALGWSIETCPIGGSGPRGEELTIDVACFAGHSPGQALVISSGVHGVEGFFGSAVQVGVLRHWKSCPPAGLPRCVFLHALNPYGFAWRRRFDEQNVDPNRNFLLPGEQYEGSPAGYASLDGLLNPRQPPSAWEPFTLKALWAIARHGMPALRQTVAGGQYEFPRGLFYGGKGPSQSHQILAARLAEWLSGAKNVVHLDFHTGLGPWSSCKLLIDYPLSDSQRAQFSEWFGTDSFEACDSTGIAYDARGGLGRWCVSRNLAENYLFACAEFGTFGPIRMLAGLRAENQAHHWGSPDSRSTLQAKVRLQELFCPASEAWRTRVLARSFELAEQAIYRLGLTRSP